MSLKLPNLLPKVRHSGCVQCLTNLGVDLRLGRSEWESPNAELFLVFHGLERICKPLLQTVSSPALEKNLKVFNTQTRSQLILKAKMAPTSGYSKLCVGLSLLSPKSQFLTNRGAASLHYRLPSGQETTVGT